MNFLFPCPGFRAILLDGTEVIGVTVFKNAKIGDTLTDFGVEEGKFSFVGNTDLPGIDLAGREVIPGLIDIHTHGCAGYDTMDGADALREMSRFHLQNGVTAFCPTTMSADRETLQAVTATLPDTDGARILGFHLEGPCLSLVRKGAQPAEPIQNARLSDMDTLENVKLITLAPEFPGALEYIEKSNLPVCLGHTAGDYTLAQEAFQKGACGVTHAMNGMPPFHHRDPGLIGAALTADRYIQVIADGVHLHPATVLLLYRAFGANRTVLISDSMRAAGLADGEYDLGGQKVSVSQKVARLSDGTLAGSACPLLTCVKRAISFGIPKEDAINMASKTPATMLGLNKGRIAPGYDADFVVVNQDLIPLSAMVEGEFHPSL